MREITELRELWEEDKAQRKNISYYHKFNKVGYKDTKWRHIGLEYV